MTHEEAKGQGLVTGGVLKDRDEQVEALEAFAHAAMEEKDRRIAELEGELARVRQCYATSLDNVAFCEEELSKAANCIEQLAEQQAMDDPWYKPILAEIRQASGKGAARKP